MTIATKPKGAGAVMADRMSAVQVLERETDPVRRLHLALNFFPTPPWATRALLEHVIPFATGTCWEPAAGEGHMAGVLAEYFSEVWRTDVHDFGGLNAVGSFIGDGLALDVVPTPSPRPDWTITNPPFEHALEFALRALDVSQVGVALLVRTAWFESEERYLRLFRHRPPSIIAQFAERVPMHLGAWNPDGGTATAYAWIVWDGIALDTRFEWIPYGCKKCLTHPDDVKRFGGAGASGRLAAGESLAPAKGSAHG